MRNRTSNGSVKTEHISSAEFWAQEEQEEAHALLVGLQNSAALWKTDSLWNQIFYLKDLVVTLLGIN